MHSTDICKPIHKFRSQRGRRSGFLRKSSLAWVALALVWIALTPCSWSQQNNSSITGVVTDPTGSVVPGASVKLTEPETGLELSATTDSHGAYKFLSLSPGSYDITVSQSGFQTFVATSFTLQVSQNAVQNVKLQVGSVQTAVTVKATPPLVDTNSAVVGQVINSKQIVTYPLNGRDFLQLATLSAGVNAPSHTATTVTSSFTGRSNVAIVVGGNRMSSTSYLLDGIEMRDDRSGALIFQPSLDALQEFKVERSFFQADNGFYPAIVNIITKSGTNKFHGEAWDFLRNTNFDGSNYFSTTGPDPYHQNQFGAIFSGPIIKNHLLFLFDYEGLRTKIGVTSNGTYPDEKQLSGDFSEPIKGKVIPIYDPESAGNRIQFPGNVVPSGRINPVALKAIDLLFPKGVTEPAQGAPNLHGHPDHTQHDDQYIGRLDDPRVPTFGRNSQLMFRLAWLDSTLDQPGLSPLRGLNYPINARNVVFQVTTPISPTMVNVFRIGYGGHVDPVVNIGADTRNISAEIGLLNTTTYAPDWAAPILGFTGFTGVGAARSYNLISRQHMYDLGDNLTFIRGNHTFKAGIDLRYFRSLYDTGTDAMGNIGFNGAFTAELNNGKLVKNTGNPIADFLLGYPTSLATATGSTHAHFRYGRYAFYFQDSWKALPNLMIQAGLRYAPSTYPYPVEGNNYMFDQATGTQLFPKLGEVPRGLLKSPHREFAPRFGFSFSPGSSRKTTIRGGVGIYFSQEQLNELQFQNFGPPFYYLQTQTQTGESVDNAYQLGVNIFPHIPPAPIVPGFTPPPGTSVFSLDPDNKTPTIDQYNLNIQHQLGQNTVVQIGYFGSHGFHLSKRYNFNTCSGPDDYLCIPSRRPFPTYGAVLVSSTKGFMNYNSLQTTFEHRMDHGFTLLANYTFQKTLDNDSGMNEGSSTERATCLECDYGPSEYAMHQRFVVSGIDELPIGRGKPIGTNMNRVADLFVGGWQVSGIFTMQSGPHYNVATSNNSSESFISTRANCVGGNIYSSHNLHSDPNHQWLNPDAFAPTDPLTFGNCSRGIYMGPGSVNLDAELSKFFSLGGEGRTLQFRAEAFNALNHTNFGIPASSVGSPTSPAANFGRISSADSARVVQLALKLRF